MSAPADVVTGESQSTKPSSRRALLGAGVGALVATVASTLGRPAPTRGANGDPVTVGNSVQGNQPTRITNTSTGPAFEGLCSSGVGVWGGSNFHYGVRGNSQSGSGVFGFSTSSNGVEGSSTAGNGVFGASDDEQASGVYGENLEEGYGVAGRCNSGPLVNGFGAAATLGDNTSNGIGVWGRSATGIGMFAQAVNANAIALKAQGVTQFNRSGNSTIQAGRNSITISIRIDPASLVLATLQQDRAGIHVRSAVPNAAGDSFTIRLNKAVGTSTRVGWFIVN